MQNAFNIKDSTCVGRRAEEDGTTPCKRRPNGRNGARTRIRPSRTKAQLTALSSAAAGARCGHFRSSPDKTVNSPRNWRSSSSRRSEGWKSCAGSFISAKPPQSVCGKKARLWAPDAIWTRLKRMQEQFSIGKPAKGPVLLEASIKGILRHARTKGFLGIFKTVKLLFLYFYCWKTFCTL